MPADTAKDIKIRHHALRNTVSNFGSKLITLGTWFLLTPFILDQLGPSGYGLWVLVGSTLAYGTLLNFGISGAVIKYVAEYRARGESQHAHSLVATALCLYSVLGLVAVAISTAIAPVFPDLFNVPPEERATATWLVRLMGLGIGISIPCAITTAVLLGLNRFDLSNLISTVGTILSAMATVFSLLLGGGVLGMVAVSVAVMLIMQVPTIWFINRIAPELRFGWRGAERSLLRTVISFGWPLFVNDVADRLQTKSDEIVIGLFLSIAFITPYAIARRLSELAQMLADQFMRILLPLASGLHAENDHVRLRSIYITGTRLTLAIFVPVGCMLIILARPILTLWVGAAYADYAHLVTILTFASLMYTSQWPAGLVLQGISRHKPLAAITMVAALGNLAVSVLLVRRIGLTGVALGTLIPATVVYLGVFLPYVMRIIGVNSAQVLKEMFLPTVLPAVPMAIVLYVSVLLFKPASLISVSVIAMSGILVYTTIYLSVAICKVERDTCRSLALSTIHLARGYLTRV